MSPQTISPCELHALRANGQPLELIDVRTPKEFREIHAAEARNVPLDTLDPARVMRERLAADQPLYVICRSGSRGKQACEKFLAAGFPQVVNVEGGTLAWCEAGLPAVRGPATVSLERQVRMVAGLLVLLGVGLGWFLQPAFLGIAALVGAGLFYAGATDRCGLALLLARMPWNRCDSSCSCPTH